MQNKFLKIFGFCLVVFGIIFFHQSAQAAIIFISPENDTIEQGQTVVVEVRLDSQKEIINAVQVRLTYDPKVLDFVEASKAGSFMTLWPEEPKADTKAGVVTFSSGVPHGSYVINGRIVSLVFRGKDLGTTQINLDSGTSGVYLNDGNGTKTNLTTRSGNLTIQIPTSTLGLTSPTHPDENTWYKSKDIKFTWNANPEAFYAYVFGFDPAALPDERFASHLGEMSYSNTEDGIHYFILREKLPNDQWGALHRFRVQIDSIPPEPITHQLTRDVVPGKLVLVFNANDLTSQIARYSINEGGIISNNASSPYILKNQNQTKAITIQAFDAAGNMTEATVPASKVVSKFPNYLWYVIGFVTVLIVIGLAILISKKSSKRNLAKAK